jgi:ankyrin repeat protein
MLSKLHCAMRKGDLVEVKSLLSEGISAFERSPQGRTSLHVAVEEGNYEAVQILIDAGVSIDAQMIYGETALHIAAEYAVTIDLCDKDSDRQGVFPKKIEQNLTNAIFEGVASGQISIASFMPNIKLSAETLATIQILTDALKTDDNRQALYDLLIQFGIDEKKINFLLPPKKSDVYEKIAELLLRNGANVNAKDANDKTPLYRASEWGTITMIKLLLDFGAEINPSHENESSPLFSAIECNRLDIVRFLIDRGASVIQTDGIFSPFHYASTYGKLDFIQLFLESGFPINVCDCDGSTPLMLCAASGNYESIVYMLQNGSNLGALNYAGKSAIHFAMESMNVKVVELLIEFGADVNAKSIDDSTPLHLLFEGECYFSDELIDCISILLKHGANPKSLDKNGQTPISLAKEYGIKEAVALLNQL